MPATKPVESSAFDEGTQFDHPAFGYARASRVQGNRSLFMSNVTHQHFIQIEVGKANMTRNYHHDRHCADHAPLITFSMTQTQFAELATGIGTGNGVPVTLERTQETPNIPDIDFAPTTQRFSKESHDEFMKLDRQVQELIRSTTEELQNAKVSKVKQAAVLHPLKELARTLGDRMPFMQKMFVEAMEGVVSEAKASVESYALQKEGSGVVAIAAMDRPALTHQD